MTAPAQRPNMRAPRGSEGRSGGVGTYPAAGRIERVDASHIVGVEMEVERSDVLPQALGTHGFRNGDQAVVEMPANDDLRRGLPMLRGDLDDHRLAEVSAASERTPGFRLDPSPVMELSKRLLLKARMELDLIDRGRYASLSDDSFEVIPIEIRNPDRADPTLLLK